MAKNKKKNGIKITSVKKDNDILKNVLKTTVVNNKKTRQIDKVEKVNDENKKVLPKKQVVNKKKTSNKAKNNYNKKPFKKIEQQISPVVEALKEVSLTQEDAIARKKERNRRKYEKGQKKYRDREEKKKNVPEVPKEIVETPIEVPEEPKVEEPITEEELVKKPIGKEDNKSLEKEKEKERKEKRKTNRKTSGFTQTLTNIKEKSVTKINDVREKTNDRTIPLGRSYDDQSKRSKRLIKESIAYAIILTIIDVLVITFTDYFNFLRLFDVRWLNVVVTIVISLIFNFFVAFMVDYFITEIWAKKRRKKDGEQDGNNRTFEGKYKEDFKDKERE